MASELELAPKVELHLHLEGAIPLTTLWELTQKYGGDPEVPSLEALDQRLHYRDFPHFIETWWWMTGYLREYDDFERHGIRPQEMAAAIRRGLDKVADTKIVLNCDLVRDTGPERAAATLAAVMEVAADADVRGITIGGSEQTYPPELFARVYTRAAAAGLRRTAHAGEAAGPESVRGALDSLGVERIGHGVRTAEDRALLDRVVAEQVPLEVCPTSNIRTGVVTGWDDHPVGELLAAGANVTISSDDPTFFHTSVAADLREVADRYGADPHSLTRAAIAASWMTETEKDGAAAAVDRWWRSTLA